MCNRWKLRVDKILTSAHLHPKKTDILIHHKSDGAVEYGCIETVGVLDDGSLAVDLVVVGAVPVQVRQVGHGQAHAHAGSYSYPQPRRQVHVLDYRGVPRVYC